MAERAPIQEKNGEINNTTPIAATFDSTPTEGNLLFAAVIIRGASNIIDSEPSGWTKRSDTDWGAGRTYAYDKIAGASEATAVSFGLSVNADARVYIAEYDTNAASPYDTKSSEQSGTATSGSTGTAAGLAQNENLAIAVWGGKNLNNFDGTPTNGFVVQYEQDNAGGVACSIAVANLIVTDGADQESTEGWTSEDEWSGVMLVYMDAEGGDPPATFIPKVLWF